MARDPQSLLRQVRAGDGQVLGPLLEVYRNYLTLLARLRLGRRLRAKLDSSDLIQETFAEALRDFGQFQGTTEEELVAWLRRILAHNVANHVRHYRTGRRNVRLERQLANELDQSSRALSLGKLPAARGSSPSQQAARREQAVLLADALERLPPDYREVILLRHVEGMKFPDIAKELSRSVDSVEKLWARGLAHLRRLLRGSS